ncbi:MAG: hypothetical protein J1E95_04190 [Muribaculaceae bacterium]|nr:hypothetical protein [Muribaculaceae bacterium]
MIIIKIKKIADNRYKAINEDIGSVTGSSIQKVIELFMKEMPIGDDICHFVMES